MRRWLKRLVIAIFALLSVGVIVIWPARVAPEQPSFLWRSSSADAGFGVFGSLGAHGIAGLVFHTAEQAAPWVLIDTLRLRMLDRVVLVNRTDCCMARGLPLFVEVANHTLQFVEVGRTDAPFAEWTVAFPLRVARFIRLRSPATTILHLREVRVP
ncbi:MAG: hypothetical protein ABW321_07270 [Polyangiales bacterium]